MNANDVMMEVHQDRAQAEDEEGDVAGLDLEVSHGLRQYRICFMPELGVDILSPIQPAAAGMAAEGLKADFGDRLCFHGGIDIQYLLPLESAGAVRAEARRRVEILGKGGGYVLAPSHNLQQDISRENILAMYEVGLRA